MMRSATANPYAAVECEQLLLREVSEVSDVKPLVTPDNIKTMTQAASIGVVAMHIRFILLVVLVLVVMKSE